MFLQKISLPDTTSAADDMGHAATVPIGAYPDRPSRLALSEPARLRIGTHLFQLRTIDISHAGAKLDILSLGTVGAVVREQNIFVPGAIALLTIRGIAFPKLGQIRWCNRRHMGFRFDDHITPAELKTLVDQASD